MFKCLVPFREPSQTLFALMQLLVANAQELSASADLSKSLGANAPATTTLALVQDQQQFISAIILRLHRSMGQEFRKLYELNARYLDPSEYQRIVDDPDANFAKDFDLTDMDVMPTANPEISSKLQRIQLAEVEISRLNEIVAAGGDPKPVVENFLRMIGTVNIEEIFPEQEPMQQLDELLKRYPQLMEVITNQQQQIQQALAARQEKEIAEQERKDAETASKIDKEAAEIELKRAQIIKTLEEAETEQTKNMSSQYTSALDIDRQAIENERLFNDGYGTDQGMESAPGNRGNISYGE